MNAPAAAQTELLLPNLEISGFRAFDRLSLPKLGRVNLIVGPNSAGKSSLLEAVRLYASGGAPSMLLELLIARDELSRRTVALGDEDVELLNPALLQIFHGGEEGAQNIRIGSADGKLSTISIERGWTVRYPEDEKQRFVPRLKNDDFIGGPRRALRVRVGEEARTVPLPRLSTFLQEVPWEPVAPCTNVGAHGLSAVEVAELWDRVALTEHEETVLEFLRIIAPVERLSLIGDYDGKGDRKPYVKVPGSRRPVPLGSLGDGLNRLLGIALALVNAPNGFVAVDEAENGLHHGVQWGVWEAVFALAERMNVQVFASTHSWDTVAAFQYAANRSSAEGMLYRLDRRPGQPIFPVAYSERDAAIAADQQVEVR